MLLESEMIDLHNHILPGLDDGAADVSVAIGMAKMAVEEGTTDLACTPHILPGLYHNRGDSIKCAVAELRQVLQREGVLLNLSHRCGRASCPGFGGGAAGRKTSHARRQPVRAH